MCWMKNRSLWRFAGLPVLQPFIAAQYDALLAALRLITAFSRIHKTLRVTPAMESKPPIMCGIWRSCWHNEPVAWSIFQVTGPMAKGSTSHLPNTCGVYLLFTEGRLRYIGSAERLSWRLHHGIHDIRDLLTKFGQVKVAFKPVSSIVEARRLEKRLQERLTLFRARL